MLIAANMIIFAIIVPQINYNIIVVCSYFCVYTHLRVKHAVMVTHTTIRVVGGGGSETINVPMFRHAHHETNDQSRVSGKGEVVQKRM